RRLNSAARDWEPALALAFSCAFRKEILGTEAGRELSILQNHLTPHLPISGFYSFGEIGRAAWRERGKTPVVALSTKKNEPAGAPTDGDETVRQDRISPGDPDAPPAEEDLESQNTFLRRKLQRSDAYRQRLESIKEYNSRMHRMFMEEIDAARRELQEKEAALRKSEEKFRRIVQTTGEGFLLMDETLTIMDVNDAYSRMLGYSRSEIIGKTSLDLATPEFRQYLASNQEELLAREERKIEGELAASDGRPVPVLIHGNTLRDDKGEIIGHMAFVTDMTEQKKALALAAEVQRNLLPRENPSVPGLDVAGRNISCDEVGGDYYDFFWRRESPRDPFSVVVGDITGHGVDAALLMTSARAFLRMHAARGQSITRIVNAMNRHLAEDVLDSGRFMTLFCLSIAPDLNSLEWVRAGHDPAILYDPAADAFDDLKGRGVALGIDSDFSYELNRRTDLRNGLVIAIGTDGIWEAADKDGEMFGKERFKALLRRHAAAPAGEILNAVFTNLDRFTLGRKSEDDITLVIIKIQKK
ncbi:MAG: SpoIIE family protein phosphatase, partial [Desulfobacterales bacterium]|nr:SpoIIE family protein phosphatase [Desulfobacterales bacterium]